MRWAPLRTGLGLHVYSSQRMGGIVCFPLLHKSDLDESHFDSANNKEVCLDLGRNAHSRLASALRKVTASQSQAGENVAV